MKRHFPNVPTRIFALAVALGVAGFAVACGDDGNSNPSSALIVASQGGTVSIDGDETAISIPAGALSQDTEIGLSYATLSDYGTLEHAHSRVLVMEPAGTQLSTPATVVFDPGAPAVSASQVVTVYQYVDGGWYGAQSGQVVSGGLISVTVDYLAPLAVVALDPPLDPTGTIQGSVFHIYTEEPLEGYSFVLMDGSTEIDTATSDAEGVFTFTEVVVGTYTVHADLTADQNCYSDPVDKEAIVTEDQTTDVAFFFVPGPC
ncbi:MAG: SpaA isopeptide-forming pilin-related protein [bacterium]